MHRPRRPGRFAGSRADAQKNQRGRDSIEPSSAPMLCIARSDFCWRCRKSMIGRESSSGVAVRAAGSRSRERRVCALANIAGNSPGGRNGMSQTFDVISVGSGHHGLVAAAYMAKAGKSVLVLERHDYAGGGCVTKELIPAHHYDEHATVHQVILSNPLLKDD